MSQFKGKKFFFTGEFTFFSDAQRNDAINFHEALIANTFEKDVDFIVIGNEFNQKILDQQTNETVFSEWDFTRNVIRSMHSSGKSENEHKHGEEDSLSVEIDIEELVSIIDEVENQKIYSCLFIYPNNDDENPIIRCLFSYIKEGKNILFSCKGLTDNSSGLPHSQFGMLSITKKNVTATAFESYENQPIDDEIYIAQADAIDGLGFYESKESDKPLKLSKKSIAALKKLDEFHNNCYFIDEVNDGYYRVSQSFYKQHIDEIEADDSYIDEDFSEEIYYACESVLSTGRGWIF